MSSDNELKRSILGFLDMYLAGEFGDLRIKAESLLPRSVVSEVVKAIKDTEELDLGYRGDEPWRTCPEKWCKSPEEAGLCTSNMLFINLLLDELNKGDGLFFEKVLILFWNFHASAYERWEDSFDYDAIGCRLHLARQVADAASQRLNDPRQLTILECLHDLVFQVHHGAYVENSMISNNPEAFQRHAGQHAVYSGRIIARLNEIFPAELTGDKDLLQQFAEKMLDYLRPVELQHKALENVGELMKLVRNDRVKFTLEWNRSMKEIREACRSLEEAGNFEAASELRAHIAGLELHHAHINDPRITMQMVDGFFHYGFYIEHSSENYGMKSNDRFFSDLMKFLENQEDKTLGEATFESISEDPAPDILESSVGEEHFQNVLLVFRPMQVRELSKVPEESGRLIGVLTPKLYHYALGVGMLSFEFTMEKLSVPEFYAIKHMSSRHSGQFEYWDTDEEGGPSSLYSQTRLVDIARRIITVYSEKFLKFTSRKNSTHSSSLPVPWIEVDQTWFTHFQVYRFLDDQGKQLDAGELEQFYEYPGVLSYQRADRASLDDWINLSVEAMQMKNLAPIRAHKGDLYVISENHSICYLPDDPKFIVLQYGETSKWVFLIRCLMLYCMAESHRVHARLKRDLSLLDSDKEEKKSKDKRERIKQHYEELIEKRAEVQRHRSLTMGMLEHAVSIGVSEYADHGLLLKNVFEETGMVVMIDRLQERIEGLADTQEGITVVLEDLKARQDKISRQRLDLLLFLLTLVQIIQSVYLIYDISTGAREIHIGPLLIYTGVSLGIIIAFVQVYHPLTKNISRLWNRFVGMFRKK
jgi:hypothetical protein